MEISDRIAHANAWLSTPERQALMARLAVIYGLIFVATTLIVSVTTQGIMYGSGGLIGADFLAFYTAADMTLQGRALEAYEFAAFDAALQTRAASEDLGMMWQYPPVMFLIVAPLALLPYKISFWLWMSLTACIYAVALARIIKDVAPDPQMARRAFLLLLTAPICVSVFVNGQVSLLTGALLMSAAYKPKAHWFVAGLAAGLLTIKPQLGLLLPLAFIFAGAWRAFALAALVSVILHGASLLVFGPEGFSAFFMAVSRLQADVAGAGLLTPPISMTTIFGQLRIWDVPASFALPVQYLTALGVFGFVMWAWYRFAKDEAHGLYLAALLGGGAILVTPYAYAYEMTVFAPAALWLAFQAKSYQRYAVLILTGFWLALSLRRLLPPDFLFQIPFLATASVFVLLACALPTAKNRSVPVTS